MEPGRGWVHPPDSQQQLLGGGAEGSAVGRYALDSPGSLLGAASHRVFLIGIQSPQLCQQIRHSQSRQPPPRAGLQNT